MNGYSPCIEILLEHEDGRIIELWGVGLGYDGEICTIKPHKWVKNRLIVIAPPALDFPFFGEISVSIDGEISKSRHKFIGITAKMGLLEEKLSHDCASGTAIV